MTKKTGDKSFAKQLMALNKKAMAQSQVVSLEEYRAVSKHDEERTIVVVDDELVIRNAIKRIFEKDNFKVLSAKDPMELSKIIEDTKPDLIILDIGLPWVNGLELCTLFKCNPLMKDIPVAVISGNKTEEDIRKGFEAGCDEYITKPFEVDDLYRVVIQLLEKKSRA